MLVCLLTDLFRYINPLYASITCTRASQINTRLEHQAHTFAHRQLNSLLFCHSAHLTHPPVHSHAIQIQFNSQSPNNGVGASVRIEEYCFGFLSSAVDSGVSGREIFVNLYVHRALLMNNSNKLNMIRCFAITFPYVCLMAHIWLIGKHISQ